MILNIFRNRFLINSLWLIIDKIYLLLGGVIVSVMVAKYFGPENLGKFTYGIMLSLLCTTFSQWGASYFIFNLASKCGDKVIPFINATEFSRTLIYIISWIIASLYLYLTLPFDDFFFISVIVISGVFNGLDIYQYYFNGILKSKYNARISIVARSISISIRLVIVGLGGSLWFLVVPVLVEGALVYFYKRRKVQSLNPIKIRGNNLCSRYYKESFTFLMSTVLVVLFTKVNELLLQQITGFHQLGVYTAAMTLSVAWTFLPLSIGTSLLGKIINNKKYEALTFVNFLIISMSIIFCLIIYFFSEEVVRFTYGNDYIKIADIILFTCASASFSVLNIINNRYIASLDGGASYLFKKLLFLAISGVLITYILVDFYGLKGAAYSLLLMEFISYTVGNYFFKKINVLSVQINMLNFKVIKIGIKIFR